MAEGQRLSSPVRGVVGAVGCGLSCGLTRGLSRRFACVLPRVFQRMFALVFALVFALALMLTSGAGAAELTVLSAGAIEPGIRPALAAFERESGHTARLTFATAPRPACTSEAC